MFSHRFNDGIDKFLVVGCQKYLSNKGHRRVNVVAHNSSSHLSSFFSSFYALIHSFGCYLRPPYQLATRKFFREQKINVQIKGVW